MKKILIITILFFISLQAIGEEKPAPTEGKVNILFVGSAWTYKVRLMEQSKKMFEAMHPGLTVNVQQKISHGGLFVHDKYIFTKTWLEQSTITNEEIKKRIDLMEKWLVSTKAPNPEEFQRYYEKVGRRVYPFKEIMRKHVKTHRKGPIRGLQKFLTDNPKIKWDYVVLEATNDVFADMINGYAQSVKNFAEVCKPFGTKIILYMPASGNHNPEPVSEPLNQESVNIKKSVAKELLKLPEVTGTIPVFEGVNKLQKSHKELTFCFKKKKEQFPNHRAILLTLNLFYASIFNKTPEGLSFDTVHDDDGHGKKLDPDVGPKHVTFNTDETTLLQKTAFEVIQEFKK